MLDLLWLLIALPLAGAAVLLLAGRRAARWGHYLGCATVGAGFVIGVLGFLALADRSERSVERTLFEFIGVGSLQIDIGLLYDPLSAVFVLLITGVGFLIHVYSIGYLSHDPARRRFFAYLNLFVAAMLLLVLANDFVGLYIGWEGVGLASYLLIAFWHHKPAAAVAAKKAFLMNRVGDVGLALAIFLMWANLGTTSYSGVFAGVENLSAATATSIAILLLLGACGKSGQFPLQAWLPDAMEGPTPVSALIHAATMVTAGVYLIVRAAPIFDASPIAQLIVCIVGAVTLLIGCIIGCAKDDIKRILAYSTVSQIGYMFLAAGLGGPAYALAILHLLTHGFFKAGLFLGAGSVMHAMKDQTDIRRFGGLARYMPVTAITFGLGYLAIIGLPPLSGFFSKDPIIEHAFDRPGWTGWVFGGAALLGAGITAFYMTRLMVLTFFGRRRWDLAPAKTPLPALYLAGHPHPGMSPCVPSSSYAAAPAALADDALAGAIPRESPWVMTVPMGLLALGSVGAGYLLTQADALSTWLAPVIGAEQESVVHKLQPATVTWAVLGMVAVGALLAAALYARGTARTEPATRNPLVLAARRN
ncbi:MAG: NADH-quinone oxidoreductase subunit L, partial [Mycobacteriales bacterium]